MTSGKAAPRAAKRTATRSTSTDRCRHGRRPYVLELLRPTTARRQCCCMSPKSPQWKPSSDAIYASIGLGSAVLSLILGLATSSWLAGIAAFVFLLVVLLTGAGRRGWLDEEEVPTPRATPPAFGLPLSSQAPHSPNCQVCSISLFPAPGEAYQATLECQCVTNPESACVDCLDPGATDLRAKPLHGTRPTSNEADEDSEDDENEGGIGRWRR